MRRQQIHLLAEQRRLEATTPRQDGATRMATTVRWLTKRTSTQNLSAFMSFQKLDAPEAFENPYRPRRQGSSFDGVALDQGRQSNTVEMSRWSSMEFEFLGAASWGNVDAQGRLGGYNEQGAKAIKHKKLWERIQPKHNSFEQVTRATMNEHRARKGEAMVNMMANSHPPGTKMVPSTVYTSPLMLALDSGTDEPCTTNEEPTAEHSASAVSEPNATTGAVLDLAPEESALEDGPIVRVKIPGIPLLQSPLRRIAH